MQWSATRKRRVARALRIPASSLLIVGTLAGLTACGSSGSKKQDDPRISEIRSACKSDLRSVEVAAEAYYARHGQYPVAITDLVQDHFLRAAPASSDFTIRLSPGTGNAAPTISGTVNRGNTAC